MSPRLRMNMTKVLVITVSFVLISLSHAFYNNALLQSVFSIGPSEFYTLKGHLFINFIIGVIAGVLGGIMLVYINNRLFRRRSFRYAMISTAIMYFLVFGIVITVISSIFTDPNRTQNPEGQILISRTLNIMYDPTTLTSFVMWGVITLITLFMLQVNDKFGPRMLVRFLAGKYYQPRQEQRLFLFSDMKSSTTIAEELGNAQYFNLLQDIFTDITDAILDSDGEIYQYVGDEIVVSWDMKRAQRANNALNCFFRMKASLEAHRERYEKRYGLLPEFRAGLHHGKVMAGEIGVAKKEIIYSGDVLNTTARIMEQAKHKKADVLISDDCLNQFNWSGQFSANELGEIELRGKHDRVSLRAIHPATG